MKNLALAHVAHRHGAVVFFSFFLDFFLRFLTRSSESRKKIHGPRYKISKQKYTGRGKIFTVKNTRGAVLSNENLRLKKPEIFSGRGIKNIRAGP